MWWLMDGGALRDTILGIAGRAGELVALVRWLLDHRPNGSELGWRITPELTEPTRLTARLETQRAIPWPFSMVPRPK
jgi:hypothetical protein